MRLRLRIPTFSRDNNSASGLGPVVDGLNAGLLRRLGISRNFDIEAFHHGLHIVIRFRDDDVIDGVKLVGIFGRVCNGAWIIKCNGCLGRNAIAKFEVLRNQLFHTGRAFPMGPIFGTRSREMTASVATTAKKHRLERARICLMGRKGSLKSRTKCTGHCGVW